MALAVPTVATVAPPATEQWDVVEVAEHLSQLNLRHVSAQRPTRKIYPGSRSHTTVDRRDCPQRYRNYVADEADHILFEGSYLQPTDPLAVAKKSPRKQGRYLLSGGGLRTKDAEPLARRADGGDWEELSGQSHPLKDANLPSLPLCLQDAAGTADSAPLGICVIGGTGAGKSCLVFSMLALLREGLKYPSRFDAEADSYPDGTPAFGAHYKFVRQNFRTRVGEAPVEREILLTDTRACGLGPGENPLVAGVSPNSTRHFTAIPQWMRIAITHTPMKALVMTIDSMGTPLWEDEKTAKALARLCSVLLRNRFTVLFAVTKLPTAFFCAKARQNGSPSVGPEVELPNLGPGKVTCYESYAQKYLSRVSAAVQAAAEKNGFPIGCEEEPDFPRAGRSMFDVVTFRNVGDFKECLGKRCTKTLPNFQYAQNQMERLFKAAVREAPKTEPQTALQLEEKCPF